jgi:hypothetical protein
MRDFFEIENQLLLALTKFSKSGVKAPDHVRGQGAKTVQKRSVHEVREHFEAFCNAAIGH